MIPTFDFSSSIHLKLEEKTRGPQIIPLVSPALSHQEGLTKMNSRFPEVESFQDLSYDSPSSWCDSDESRSEEAHGISDIESLSDSEYSLSDSEGACEKDFLDFLEPFGADDQAFEMFASLDDSSDMSEPSDITDFTSESDDSCATEVLPGVGRASPEPRNPRCPSRLEVDRRP